ncbi:MAG: UbiD family decarboxylase [Phycisphaerales bacterium]|nr:UbiD family decarboxylase [Phycisphaerales bacterium]
MYGDLREFLSALERAGELARISAPISPVLEIAAIADRMSKQPAPRGPSVSARRNDPRFHHLGGKALLFTNVEGSDIPVAINAFGSYRRMEMALGCNDAGTGAAAGHTPGGFDALAARIGELVKPEFPRSLREVISKARGFLPLLSIPPKRRRGMGLCQEVIHTADRIDLMRLPFIRCWPLDGDLAAVGYPADVNAGIPGMESGPDWERNFRGRYITLGGVHTIHASDEGNPKPGSHNIGMYRVQLLGRRHMAMHWHLHHDGARHWRSWKAHGRKMPVAIALGGQSVLPYAATAPLPPGISELLLAGFLNRGGIEMVMGRTVPIWVPAHAEIVIEGYVSDEAGLVGWDPGQSSKLKSQSSNSEPLGPGAVFEGPFGDHTGFYSMPDRYPILEVTAITHRRDPIYPTTIVGQPPQEDYFLGKATERLFLPLLKTLIPDIEDYDLPMFGAFHNCAFLKIDKQYAMQGRRVMHSVWGAGQMAWTKSIFVVDQDVDVHDTPAVLRAAIEHCRPGWDNEMVNGPLDILDHAAPALGVGMKIGFDCTRKIAGEENGQSAEAADPLETVTPAHILGRMRGISGIRRAALPESCGYGWLFVTIEKRSPGQGHEIAGQIARALGFADKPSFVVILDDSVNIDDVDEAMFHFCANCDVSRDMQQRTRMAIFDATPKLPGDDRDGRAVRPWPPIIRMSEEITRRITERRGELGLDELGLE